MTFFRAALALWVFCFGLWPIPTAYWADLNGVLIAQEASAAVSCGAVSSAMAEPPSANPQTLAWTPSATGGIAIVAIGFDDTDAQQTTISTVTSTAGGTFTQLALARCDACGGADQGAAIWYSTDYNGGAQTLSVTYSSTVVVGAVAAYVCTGVNTASPWHGAGVTGTSDATGSVSINVPSAVGELVIDNVFGETSVGGVALDAGAGQTGLYALTPGTDDADMAGSTEAGAGGNVTMSWSVSGTTALWATVGGSLVPSTNPRRPAPPLFFQ